MYKYYPLKEGPLVANNAVAALIQLEYEKYLCQLRSSKKGIFFPEHWGLFGGAVEHGENELEAIRRELQEELGVSFNNISFFTEFTFDFSYKNSKKIWRKYFRVNIDKSQLGNIKLGEGTDYKFFSPEEILLKSNVVPYDKFVIWMNEKEKLNE